MNLNRSSRHTIEQNSVAITPTRHFVPAGPKIERGDFENLLQRAMEILNARAKTPASSHA